MAKAPKIRAPSLKAPTGPQTRLRLSPVRNRESEQLDNVTEFRASREERYLRESVPFIQWQTFITTFDWEQGQHITIVGSTGSGKTTLALSLLPLRTYIVVLATKNRDPSLYPKLEAEGYKVTEDPKLDAEKTPKVIFRPKLDTPTRKDREIQSDKFAALLVNIFREGHWCVYGDEVRYLTQNLGLSTELETLWLQGRSLEVSIVVSTQRPVSIPVLAFESATHLFLFRTTDAANVQRASEFAGADQDVVKYMLPRLQRYETLYIDTRSGEMSRTMVR